MTNLSFQVGISVFELQWDCSIKQFCHLLISSCSFESISCEDNAIGKVVISICNCGLLPFIFNNEYFWELPFSAKKSIIFTFQVLFRNKYKPFHYLICSKENTSRLNILWKQISPFSSLGETLLSLISTCLSNMKAQSVDDVDLAMYAVDENDEETLEWVYYQFCTLLIQVEKNGLSSQSLLTILDLFSNYPQYNSSLLCMCLVSLSVDCLSMILQAKPSSPFYSLSFFGGKGIVAETSRQTASHSSFSLFPSH